MRCWCSRRAAVYIFVSICVHAMYDTDCNCDLCSSLILVSLVFFFFFSSRRRHTRSDRDWSSDVCSSDLLSERGVERRHELGAVPAERVAGAGVDERLEDALVAEAQVDPVAQVDERAVRPPRGPPGENRLDRARADVLDRAEAEAEPAVADHRELEPGLVDVRRQHLEA